MIKGNSIVSYTRGLITIDVVCDDVLNCNFAKNFVLLNLWRLVANYGQYFTNSKNANFKPFLQTVYPWTVFHYRIVNDDDDLHIQNKTIRFDKYTRSTELKISTKTEVMTLTANNPPAVKGRKLKIVHPEK